MKSTLRGWRLAAPLAAVVILGLGSSSQAALQLTVQETGGAAIVITDDSPLDINTTDPGVITVDTQALNLLLVNYQFSDLGATSNALLGVAGSNQDAVLRQTGTALRTTTAGTADITITATETEFDFPSGDPKTMASGATSNFTFSDDATQRTFTSFFGPDTTGTASDTITFDPPSGTGPFEFSDSASPVNVGDQPTPFGLTNVTVITQPAAVNDASRRGDQFSGTTTLSGANAVVPEPSSLLLIGTGLPLFALGMWRRRRASA